MSLVSTLVDHLEISPSSSSMSPSRFILVASSIPLPLYIRSAPYDFPSLARLDLSLPPTHLSSYLRRRCNPQLMHK